MLQCNFQDCFFILYHRSSVFSKAALKWSPAFERAGIRGCRLAMSVFYSAKLSMTRAVWFQSL